MTQTTPRRIQPWVKKLAAAMLERLVSDGDVREFNGPNCIIEFEDTLQKAFDEGEVFAYAKREI